MSKISLILVYWCVPFGLIILLPFLSFSVVCAVTNTRKNKSIILLKMYGTQVLLVLKLLNDPAAITTIIIWLLSQNKFHFHIDLIDAKKICVSATFQCGITLFSVICFLTLRIVHSCNLDLEVISAEQRNKKNVGIRLDPNAYDYGVANSRISFYS